MNLMLRVALFLRDEASLSYDLIPSDLAILLILASHLGERKFWYISQKDIAKECRLKHRQFYERSKKLEFQKLITITRTGKANAYGITLPKITGKSWSDDQRSTADHENSDQRSTADQISALPPIRSAPECLHKETIRKQKETERATLSDFIPNEANQQLMIELDLNSTGELLSFMNRHKGDKSQYEFERWIKRSAEYQRNKAGTKTEAAPQRRVFFGEPGEPTYDAMVAWDKAHPKPAPVEKPPARCPTPKEAIALMKAAQRKAQGVRDEEARSVEISRDKLG